MPRGRKPIPTRLKEISGAFDKDPQRRNDLEPVPPPGLPTCPDYLNDFAKAEWWHICDLLKQMGLLSTADESALIVYCQTWGEWRKAVDMVAKYGAWTVIKQGNGEVATKRTEFDRIRERTAEQLRRWLLEFGLTPSSRSRVQVNVSPEDELDVFLHQD
jgi:P27 family predicted phage terminase small subunit